MQNVTLNIENDFLEKKLLDLSHKSRKEINEIIMDLLFKYFREGETGESLKYRILNPLENMHKLDFSSDDSIPMTNPFLNIPNVIDYSKDLRKQAWK
jgi:hypothetical protein